MKINKLNIVLVLFLLFFSCYDNSNFNEEKIKIFRYNESSGITSLDPIYSNNKPNIWAVNHIFNGLVQFDNNLDIQPCIAKEWFISEDGLTYTFFLRNDVYFHESQYFTKNIYDKRERLVSAEDFVYSFNRLKDSPGNWLIEEYFADNGLYMKNDTILTIKLKKPSPHFLNLLTMKYFSVVPKEVVENSDFSREPIGTGPFSFKYWKDNVKMVLLKNNNYFEKKDGYKLPYLDAINISFLQNEESLFINFLQGNIDLVSGLSPIFKESFLDNNGELIDKHKDKFKIYKTPYLNTEYLAFNLPRCDSINSLLQYKDMREAINYGFDRKKIIKYLKNNVGFSGNSGIVPPYLANYELDGYYYNPDTVYDLLINIKGDKEITLHTTSNYLDICEYLQSSFSDFGIKLNIKVDPPSIFKEKASTGGYCFFRASWIADYPDPENYFALFFSKNKSPDGPNKTYFTNKNFDDLYEKSFLTQYNNERTLFFQSMEEIIMDESIIVPLYYDMAIRFVSNKIEGLSINSMNLLTLKEVKKK